MQQLNNPNNIQSHEFKKPIIINGETLIDKKHDVLYEKPKLIEHEKGYLIPEVPEDLLRFHPEVVLYCPQIPQNTGSIARMCAAFSCNLHLIEPLGFSITEKGLRRAGLDYWDFVNVYVHKNWDLFKETFTGRRLIFIETGGTSDVSLFAFQPGDVLIFGAETFGIHKEILEKEMSPQTEQNNNNHTTKSNLLSLPMYHAGVRSLNLSNTVSIVTYTALSKIHYIFSHAVSL